MDYNISSNLSNETSTHHSDSSSHGKVSATVLFLFLVFALGAAVRHLLKHTPLPYTVVLIVVGLIVGAAPRWSLLSFLNDYLQIAQLDPHLMLIIFLPTLIFESAFVLDVHTFRKMIWQASLLAGPGLLVSTFLTSIMARYIFTYSWSWVVALMFGTILNATDPVAIVALLRELGASKQLGTIIEGESLLNDGAAIVLFNVLRDELIPGSGRSGVQIFLYFLRVALGGPVFGYAMAKLSIFWLSRVYNDALVEIAITLASTYVTYYIGEEFLGVSGVLAVVALGYEINSRKTNISPEVEVFLHRFWEVLGYFANTLIFTIVGVVISQRAFEGVEPRDWMFLASLYFGIIVIRMVVTAGFFPILTHIGYSISMRHVLVISWGGLKGAVSLALALGVAQTSAIDFNTIGSKVLFHTAGIVILTLVVNATTTKYLLKALGMRDISIARCRTVSSAVARANEAKQRTIALLKGDRFLADANWDIVNKTATIPNPYRHIEFPEGFIVNSLENHHCPQCKVEVPRLLNNRDLAELAEEIRGHIIKREKTSYWHQFEQGMLSQEAVRVLISLADTVMDTPERLITLDDIALHWTIPKIYSKTRQILTLMIEVKSRKYPEPTDSILSSFYSVATHSAFEWIIYPAIVMNVLWSIIEIIITEQNLLNTLIFLNYCFCFIYLIEAVIKMIGLRKYYWLIKWNYFDLLLLLFALVDIAMTQVFSNNMVILTVLRSLRVLRLTRLLQSANSILPGLIKIVDYFANRHLRFGYDIGRGFIVGEEDLLPQFDRLKQIDPTVAENLKHRVEETRLRIIRSLGLIRKEYPGIALSVKTQHATRAVLNNCKEAVKTQLSNGLLDEVDAMKLIQIIERKTKRLENTRASLPPSNPDLLFSQLSWLNGLDSAVVKRLRNYAKIQQYNAGDFLTKAEECSTGLFIVISGLVKVINVVFSSDQDIDKEVTVTDYLGPGAVIGEMGILLNDNFTALCETDVQAFFVHQDDLWKALVKFPILEERLWRIYGVRSAFVLLERLPTYQDWTANALLVMCENSSAICSLPDGPLSSIFEITEEMREVVVIHGEVHCAASHKPFVAPCIIPKRVQQVTMSTGKPKLLVIMNGEISIDIDDQTQAEEESDYPLFLAKLLDYFTKKTKRIQNLLRKTPFFKRNRIYPDEERPLFQCEHGSSTNIAVTKSTASVNVVACKSVSSNIAITVSRPEGSRSASQRTTVSSSSIGAAKGKPSEALLRPTTSNINVSAAKIKLQELLSQRGTTVSSTNIAITKPQLSKRATVSSTNIAVAKPQLSKRATVSSTDTAEARQEHIPNTATVTKEVTLRSDAKVANSAKVLDTKSIKNFHTNPTKDPDIRATKVLDTRTTKDPDIRATKVLDTRTTKDPDIRATKDLDTRATKDPAVNAKAMKALDIKTARELAARATKAYLKTVKDHDDKATKEKGKAENSVKYSDTKAEEPAIDLALKAVKAAKDSDTKALKAVESPDTKPAKDSHTKPEKTSEELAIEAAATKAGKSATDLAIKAADTKAGKSATDLAIKAADTKAGKSATDLAIKAVEAAATKAGKSVTDLAIKAADTNAGKSAKELAIKAVEATKNSD